jgi:hypothetical protein
MYAEHRVARRLLHHNGDTAYPEGHKVLLAPHIVSVQRLRTQGLRHASQEVQGFPPSTAQPVEHEWDEDTVEPTRRLGVLVSLLSHQGKHARLHG